MSQPLLLCLLLASLVGSAEVPAESPEALHPGETIERVMDAGATHVYRVESSDARVLLLTVEQQGIDVVLEIALPAGGTGDSLPLVLDSPGQRVPESALIVPKKSQIYQITIRSHRSAGRSGTYVLRLEELVRPIPERLEAERAMTEAARLNHLATVETWKAAARQYRRAYALWQDLGLDLAAARALDSAALLYARAEEPQQALVAGREVLALWQALGDGDGEARTLNHLGRIWQNLANGSEARRRFEQSREVFGALGDRLGAAQAQANLCLVELDAGELRAGARCYEKVLPVLDEFASPGNAIARVNLGNVYNHLGEPDRARSNYQEALARARALDNRRSEFHLLTSLGKLHREQGDFRQALVSYGEALAIARQRGSPRWQGQVLNNLGVVYEFLHEPRRARDHFEQALALRRRTEDRRGEAVTLNNLGRVHLALDEPEAALALQRQALDLRQQLGDRRGEAIVLRDLGRSHLVAGDPNTAAAFLKRAVEGLREVGDEIGSSRALRALGQTQAALGATQRALSTLEQALEVGRRHGNRYGETLTLYALARVEWHDGRADRARVRAEAAIEALEAQRARIFDPDLRASYGAARHQSYEFLIELLMEAHRAAPDVGHDRLAFEFSERARARSLLELLEQTETEIRDAAHEDLIERRRSLKRRLNAKATRRLRADVDAKERDRLAVEQSEILRDLDIVEAELWQKSPKLSELMAPRPRQVSELQNLLDADTTLLVYALGETRSYLWHLTELTMAVHELPDRKTIEEVTRRLHGYLGKPDPTHRRAETEAAAELGRLVLGPVAAGLTTPRLAIVPDGALHFVPFEVLPLPQGQEAAGVEASLATLLDRHEIVYLPSASVLAVQRRMLERRPPAPHWLAVVADPVFEKGDPRIAEAPNALPVSELDLQSPQALGQKSFGRLRASRFEAETIAALAPSDNTLVILDFEARRSRVSGAALLPYRFVHFATHGIIDAETPALSGLVLSLVDERGEPLHGLLGLDDIYNLRLNADLVVLSGCRTALGRELRGEGLVGLTRGFLYAGGRRVLASLWPVEDWATAELMSRFYRFLWQDGLPATAALRDAKRSLRKERRFQDPYYWAGFELQGDWRP